MVIWGKRYVSGSSSLIGSPSQVKQYAEYEMVLVKMAKSTETSPQSGFETLYYKLVLVDFVTAT